MVIKKQAQTCTYSHISEYLKFPTWKKTNFLGENNYVYSQNFHLFLE